MTAQACARCGGSTAQDGEWPGETVAEVICLECWERDCSNHVFQTKCLNCTLDTYRITENGTLQNDATGAVIPHHGALYFYNWLKDNSWLELVALFDRGKLIRVEVNEGERGGGE